jgi:hypothetical protein
MVVAAKKRGLVDGKLKINHFSWITGTVIGRHFVYGISAHSDHQEFDQPLILEDRCDD